MADAPKPEQVQATASSPATHDEPKTTITVSVKTRDRLRKLGKFGEHWDELINHLLDEYEKKASS